MLVVDTDPVEKVKKHLWDYALEAKDLRSAADELKNILEIMLDDRGILFHQVETRSKDLESYKVKSEKLMPGGVLLKYNSPRVDIEDCVAARIIVFTTLAKDLTVAAINEEFECVGEDKKRVNPVGYDSYHFIVSDFKTQRSAKSKLKKFVDSRRRFEIQVRTVAAHAWAEYEHDVRYKHEGFESLPIKYRERIDRLFEDAASARGRMDDNFAKIEGLMGVESKIVEAVVDYSPLVHIEKNDVTVETLSSLLIELYPDARRSSSKSVEWACDLVGAIKICSISGLEKLLWDVDSSVVEGLMGYRYVPPFVRRLDDDLLAALGETYIEVTKNVGAAEYVNAREKILGWRWRRLKGKLSIYQLEGDAIPVQFRDKGLSAARAFRELVEIAVNADKESALIPGYVSEENNLRPGARARSRDFDGTRLWIHGNLSRPQAEEAIGVLLANASVLSEVKVRKAGDQIFPALNN